MPGPARVVLCAVAVALSAVTAARPVIAAGDAPAVAADQEWFVARQALSTPALDDKLVTSQGGFPGVPDAVWVVGASRQWPLGGPSSPWRVGTFASLGAAEAAAAQKRVRLVQGYFGPRLAYHVGPARWVSAEAGVGLAAGVSALTLFQDPLKSLKDALDRGHESTLWRLTVAVVPEVSVRVKVHPRVGLQLSAAYLYDTGWAGGWRNAWGAALSDAPGERLSGPRYRLSLVLTSGELQEAPRPEQPPQPRQAFLGVRVVSLDVPTASRLRLNDTRGALVVQVLPGSPADRAGLMRDDVIRRFGNVEILSAQHMAQELQRYRPGDWVYVQVWRVETRYWLFKRGQLVDMMVQLGEEPQGW